MDEDGKSLVVLPDELILHILQFLKFREILNLISCLNKKFYELSKDPKLIPKSITLNLFRSSSHENNVRNRCQVADIISRASLLKTLSIEVNNTCNLNDELQQIGNGLCRVKLKLDRYLLSISNIFPLLPLPIHVEMLYFLLRELELWLFSGTTEIQRIIEYI